MRHVLVLVALAAGPAALAADPPGRTDSDGFPLPDEAVRRLGSARFRHPKPVRALAASPDGNLLFTHDGEAVYGWDLATGRMTFRTPRRQGDDSRWGAIRAAAVTVRVVGSVRTSDHYSEKIDAFDQRTGADGGGWRWQLGELLRVESPFARSPDGSLLAHNLRGEDGRWSVVVRIPGHPVPVPLGEFGTNARVHFSRDGRLVAAGDRQGPVRVFTDTGKPRDEWPAPDRWRDFVGFTADGRGLVAWVATPDRKCALQVWDRDARTARTVLAGEADAVPTRLDPAGRLVGLHRRPGGWHFHDLATGKPVGRPIPSDSGELDDFTPDGRTFLVADGHAVQGWDVAAGRPTAPGPEVRLVEVGPQGVRYAPDGRLLVLADRGLTVWAPDGRLLADGGPPVTHAVPLPGGRLAVVTDGALRLIDSGTGAVLGKLSAAPGPSCDLAASPDGGRLFWTAFGSVVEWDVAGDRERSVRAVEQVEEVERLAVSPAGRWLVGVPSATGRGALAGNRFTNRLYLWDRRAERAAPRRLRGGWPPGSVLGFSADGQELLVAEANRTDTSFRLAVRSWDLTRDTESREVDVAGAAHGEPLAFSPDGRTLAVAAADGAVHLVESPTGRLRHTFRGHRTKVRSAAFSPDGRHLAAHSPDAGVLVWDVWGELVHPPRPGAAALEDAWSALRSSDAEKAFDAARLLAAHPDLAVPLLREKFDAPPPDPARVARLIRQLDAPAFDERERASAELRRVADRVVRELEAAADGPSAEVRWRAEALLAVAGRLTKDALRERRAVEVLEWAGTPDAARLLGRWAAGGGRLAAEARRARWPAGEPDAGPR